VSRQLRRPPESLRYVARLCHQDIDRQFNTGEELIASLARSLTPAQRAELGRYLAKILDGRFTPAELRGIWDRTNPDWGFLRGEGAKLFFEALREAVVAAAAKG